MTTYPSIEDGGWLSLSSALTPLYKFGAPTASACTAALLVLVALVAREPGLLLGGLIASLAAAYLFLYCGRMKTVILNAYALHITTLRSTVTVPLDRLVDIEIKSLFYPPIAYLHFDSPTPAGQIVQFMPAGVRLLHGNPELQAVLRLAHALRTASPQLQQSRRGA